MAGHRRAFLTRHIPKGYVSDSHEPCPSYLSPVLVLPAFSNPLFHPLNPKKKKPLPGTWIFMVSTLFVVTGAARAPSASTEELCDAS